MHAEQRKDSNIGDTNTNVPAYWQGKIRRRRSTSWNGFAFYMHVPVLVTYLEETKQFLPQTPKQLVVDCQSDICLASRLATNAHRSWFPHARRNAPHDWRSDAYDGFTSTSIPRIMHEHIDAIRDAPLSAGERVEGQPDHIRSKHPVRFVERWYPRQCQAPHPTGNRATTRKTSSQ